MRGGARHPLGFSPMSPCPRQRLSSGAMKISSDPGMVSALETWLRDTAEAEPPVAHGPVSETASPVSNNPLTSPRDSVEGLLELDVWNGAPAGSRQLSTASTFQPRAAEPAGLIQAWADHIFHPLV